MEKIRDILIAVIVLVLALKLPSCYSGDGPEKDEAQAEKWAYIAEVQQEYYDYGYADAERYTEELHRQANDYYDEDFLALESLYEILCEEYGEKKADDIYDTIINNSLSRILNPADLVNDFLGEPKDQHKYFNIHTLLPEPQYCESGSFAFLLSNNYQDFEFIRICSKQLFRKIVHSIFEGTFDEDAVNEQLKRAYTKVINSL